MWAVGVAACVPTETEASRTVLNRLASEMRTSQTAVVGTVLEARGAFETNAFGDRIIVTRARVAVEETLKGTGAGAGATVEVATEGGTVGDLTLEVSDTPAPPRAQQRAVFFLHPRKTQAGLWLTSVDGVVELDGAHVRGRSLTLEDVRKLATP